MLAKSHPHRHLAYNHIYDQSGSHNHTGYNHIGLNHSSDTQDWPLASAQELLIHVNTPDESQLQNGDSYFYVTQKADDNMQLVLRHVTDGNTDEYPISDTQRQKMFAMEHMDIDLEQCSDEKLSTLLSNCVVAVETGLARMSWRDVKLSVHKSRDRRNAINFRFIPKARSSLDESKEQLKAKGKIRT